MTASWFWSSRFHARADPCSAPVPFYILRAMRRCVLPFVVVWLFFAGAPAADILAGPLEPGGTAEIVEVIDGDTVVLEDGREVRLVGIQAPKLPLGRPGFETWPLAEDAKRTLEEIALGRTVELRYGGRRMDRHGRALAHLYDSADGTWIQGEMLRRGMARVYSFPDNRALVEEMLTREREARGAGRGIWAHPFYRILTPEETGGAIDSFQLVEGRVLEAAIVRGRGYLNFGEDWQSDFTVFIDPESRRRFEAAGIDIESLEGARLRVRGWLKSFNGPEIEVTHPEQIELLER